MAQYVICPSCMKSVVADGDKPICGDCGQPIDFNEVKKRGLAIDSATEASEFAAGKDYFINTEFLSAREHFKKALDANKNSYLSQYFVLLCDIYLNESSPDYDAMDGVVNAIQTPLTPMTRANVKVNDRLNFIYAMLTETKIIIINRLRSHDKLFDLDIAKYRKNVLNDLQTLLRLFKIDGELLMTYAPQIGAILAEVADTAVAVCHKAVQTVAVGEELFSPTEFEYNRLLSLNNDFCFFVASFVPDYDVKKYTPDFTQNNLLNEKVASRFEKFDIKNKPNAKRYTICDPSEYEDILAECEKALSFTDKSCFGSLCDPNFGKRQELLKDGLRFLYRLLTPRVSVSDKKRVEFKLGKFYDISDRCAQLTKFLRDADAVDAFARDSLRDYYAKLCDIMDMYYVAEYERYTKSIDKLKDSKGDDYKYYERFLFETACSTASALGAYVGFAAHKDKTRAKLVKFCKQAAEEFLMLRDYHIDEIDQSNVYRPILDIYNAVMREVEG